MAQAYCFKCRQKREIKDPKQVTLKNNSLAVPALFVGRRCSGLGRAKAKIVDVRIIDGWVI